MNYSTVRVRVQYSRTSTRRSTSKRRGLSTVPYGAVVWTMIRVHSMLANVNELEERRKNKEQRTKSKEQRKVGELRKGLYARTTTQLFSAVSEP